MDLSNTIRKIDIYFNEEKVAKTNVTLFSVCGRWQSWLDFGCWAFCCSCHKSSFSFAMKPFLYSPWREPFTSFWHFSSSRRYAASFNRGTPVQYLGQLRFCKWVICIQVTWVNYFSVLNLLGCCGFCGSPGLGQTHRKSIPPSPVWLKNIFNHFTHIKTSRLNFVECK